MDITNVGTGIEQMIKNEFNMIEMSKLEEVD